MNKKDYIHKEFPKTCHPKDFFGQVKRTVNGEPISQEQIFMILDAFSKGLNLEKRDILLDLGCGNGALVNYIFDNINSYYGVDFSEYLISIAKENFEKEGFNFCCNDILSFLKNLSEDNYFNKALCYGVFSYFDKKTSHQILELILKKCKLITKLYIGNLPDKEKVSEFFYDDIDYTSLIDDPQSKIGIWRTKNEFSELCSNAGWDVEFINMPKTFYSAHYRYDAILIPKKQ